MRSLIFGSFLLVSFSTFAKTLTSFAAPDTLPQVEFFYNDTFCSSQMVLVNNHLYGPFNPTGIETLPGAAQNGADSVIFVNLTFLEPAFLQIDQTLCRGDTLWVGGTPFHAGRRQGTVVLDGGAANGCDSTIDVKLNVLQLATTKIEDTLCLGEKLVINGKTFNENKPIGLVVFPGASQNGCDSVVLVDLTFQKFRLSIGKDKEISLGDTVCLYASSLVPLKWIRWEPDSLCPDSNCRTICLQPEFSDDYRVTVSDDRGCTATTAIEILVYDDVYTYQPTAIKYDGTFPNDHFFIGTDASVESIKRLLIANRWGEIVFDGKNLPVNSPENGWDGRYNGKAAPPGQYTFVVEFQLINGRLRVKKGSFSMIR